MKLRLREFNELGINAFASMLQEIREGKEMEISNSFLEKKEYSSQRSQVFVERKPFTNKESFAKYILKLVRSLNDDSIFYSRGLWTWLAAFYFNDLASKRNGKIILKKNEFYILSEEKEFRRYYRHLIASPVRMLALLGNDAKVYFDVPISVHGEFAENLLSYQQFATSRTFVRAVHKLYFDKLSKQYKKGAKGKNGIRRLMTVAGQLYLNWNLETMSEDQILNLLPREFDKWKN